MTEPEREPPPTLGSWKRVYAVEIGALVAVVALLRWLTVAAS